MQEGFKLAEGSTITIDLNSPVSVPPFIADIPALAHLPGPNTFQFVVDRNEFMRRTTRVYTTHRFRKFQSTVQLKDSAKNYAVAIIGAGPSLADQLETIRSIKGQAIIFALNNAHDYLIENGVKVDVAMLIEAKERAVNYITPNHKTRYLIASQVHDKTLDKFLPFAKNTHIFHCLFDDEHREMIKQLRAKHKYDVFGISGGSSVGMRAFDFVVDWMKSKHVHMFGMDSSCKDEPIFGDDGKIVSGGVMHAKPKDGANPAFMATQIRAPGGRVIWRKYYTDPVMRRQAGEMVEILKHRADDIRRGEMEPFGIAFHGRGLLPDWMAFLGFHTNNEEIVRELIDETEKHELEAAQANGPASQIGLEGVAVTLDTDATRSVETDRHRTADAIELGKPSPAQPST